VYGIARYAQRYGGAPLDFADFKAKEEKFNIRYVCVYPRNFLESIHESSLITDYIMHNYHLKELGLVRHKVFGYVIFYVLFAKGSGDTDIEKVISAHLDKLTLRKTYGLPGISLPFYTIRIP
jgi:hypothetical protein